MAAGTGVLDADAAGSIPVIEDFYAESLSHHVIVVARQTPFEQLLVLAERVNNQHLKLLEQLRNGAAKRRCLTLHEDFYIGSDSQVSIAGSPGFKHWVLLAERLVVPDHVFGWARRLCLAALYDNIDEDMVVSAGPDLALRLARLLELRPLVQCGAAFLISDQETFDPQLTLDRDFADDSYMSDFHTNQELEDWNLYVATRPRRAYAPLSDYITREGGYEILWEDPYLAWVIVNRLNLEPPWSLRAKGLGAPELLQEAAEWLVRDHGLDHRFNEVWQAAYPGLPVSVRALQMAALSREAGMSPVASSPVARDHLMRSSSALLAGEGATLHETKAVQDAVRLTVPDVSQVSLRDIVRLRESEDVYEDFRHAYLQLLGSVGNLKSETYGALQTEVRKAAADILLPTYERLERLSKASRLRSTILGFAAGGLLSLGLNGLATLVGGPAGLALRTPVGMGSAMVRNRVQKHTAWAAAPKEIACGLLASTLGEESGEE